MAELGDTLTELEPPEVPEVTVTVAPADFVISACAVAVTVAVDGFGTLAGAVYNPALVMLPLAVPPATLHDTPMFDVPVTVAVNCCVFPTGTLAAIGETEIATEVVVLLVEPAQPASNMQPQAKPLINGRMKILTGGMGLHQAAGLPKRLSYTTMLDYISQ